MTHFVKTNDSPYWHDADNEEWWEEYISDDFGSYWPRFCKECGAPNVIIRPGDCRCSKECHQSQG